MEQPSLRVTSVSIAAPDPRVLAAFYSRLLGRPVTTTEPARPGFPPEDGWAQIRPPEGAEGPTLNFEYEAGFVPPVWPSVEGRQQLQTHLDIAVDDLDAAVDWAEGSARCWRNTSRRTASASCWTRPATRSASSAPVER
jgi:catechol 2,3-dioxygenase-like lactoylglutathione lyase family enzyme